MKRFGATKRTHVAIEMVRMLEQTKIDLELASKSKQWLARTSQCIHIMASSVEGTPRDLWVTRCGWHLAGARCTWILCTEEQVEAHGASVCKRCWKE